MSTTKGTALITGASTGTEVQLEASGYGDLIQKLTELYSGCYNA